MEINANDIRVGNILDHEKRLWMVLKTMHTQPGKGGAYMQVEMKDIKSGTKLNIRYRSSETVSKAALDPRDFQVLYVEKEGNSGKIAVMDMESYEQMDISLELIAEEQRPFVTADMKIIVEFYDESPVAIRLPTTTVATVCECEAVVKGQTAAASYKPAILDNGVRIMVPPFIEINDRVVVRVETCEYIEREKK